MRKAAGAVGGECEGAAEDDAAAGDGGAEGVVLLPLPRVDHRRAPGPATDGTGDRKTDGGGGSFCG